MGLANNLNHLRFKQDYRNPARAVDPAPALQDSCELADVQGCKNECLRVRYSKSTVVISEDICGIRIVCHSWHYVNVPLTILRRITAEAAVESTRPGTPRTPRRVRIPVALRAGQGFPLLIRADLAEGQDQQDNRVA
jgi:hypothetical protein